ncbi:ATP-dependent RecD-like DNA helicase [Neolewinella maritima]|uniref:ATP-dependent RecD-like DNA helicase n=1 Tax=Neolewinella maritima TaxID=1383882 RepID=A0ABN8F552_9BACT|nr:AAA family ATPase [Neolewinella maritima]CAH0999057.1 ATP-dependent RecD-like DNA helicase [Neolewinella maritima]
MHIHDHFQHLTLTDDQDRAVTELGAFIEGNDRAFILRGYAGSGKTTLLKGLVSYLRSTECNYQLMAPTGRAAKIIQEKTQAKASTIHRGIYAFNDLHEVEAGEATTDVSFLYAFKLRQNADTFSSILIVDEASMVGNTYSEQEFFRFGSGRLLNDLIDYGRIADAAARSKIIFVGDSAQLPPVGMSFSPALDDNYLNEHFGITARSTEMSRVVRQAEGNGILQAATNIRRSMTSGFFNDFDLRANGTDLFTPRYADFLQTYKEKSGKKLIICYKNRTAWDINQRIRKDKFGSDLPIQERDIVIIGRNNYKAELLNGEFAVVNKADANTVTRNVRFNVKGGKTESVDLTWRSVELLKRDESGQVVTVTGYILENFLTSEANLNSLEQRALYIDFKQRHPKLRPGTPEFKVAIADDEWINCILLKYGYAVTCHKAQGGEWQSAFVLWDRGITEGFDFFENKHTKTGKDNQDFYRWAYTAVTRAADQLYCINPPHFTSFSNLTFVDNGVEAELAALTGIPAEAVEVEFAEVLPVLEQFNLQDAPLSIQDHFIRHHLFLRKKYIDICGWERISFEIWYTFQREGQTAGIKFWVNKKVKFNKKSQKLSNLTTSDDLYDEIIQLLPKVPPVIVNRDTVESILPRIQFELEVEEEKPFLKRFYAKFVSRLSDDMRITHLLHQQNCERYTFEKSGKTCIFDLRYKDNGFFTTIKLLPGKCEDPTIILTLKDIIHGLKS